jgi:pimeloyl-ACP methyl ester carboxylesterase
MRVIASLGLAVVATVSARGVLAAPAAKPAPAASAAPGHVVALRGIRMYFEVHGKGPALLLLHGGAGNGMQFSHQVPAFETHYRLIVPDACAQGRTSDRPGDLTYHAMAEDVIALMDQLHVPVARVVGWSDGGDVGLDMAMNHPERVSHLVTFGANFNHDGLNPQDIAWADTATAASFGPDMEKGWRALSPEPDHYTAAMTKILALWRTQPNWTAADLGRIRARTLVIAGDHDLIRRDHSEALAKAIPRARLWIVPDANHSVMIEKPEVVNPVVLEFLAK